MEAKEAAEVGGVRAPGMQRPVVVGHVGEEISDDGLEGASQ